MDRSDVLNAGDVERGESFAFRFRGFDIDEIGHDDVHIGFGIVSKDKAEHSLVAVGEDHDAAAAVVAEHIL